MMQQSICAQVRVRVLNFAQQEGKRRGGHAWCGGFPSPAKGPTKTWILVGGRPSCRAREGEQEKKNSKQV